VAEPDLVVPLEPEVPARYALERWRPATGWLKQGRNRIAGRLIETGWIPPLRALQTVGSRQNGQPFLIRAAVSLGVPEDVSWFLTPGQAEPLTRGVFTLFRPRGREPEWALKFARVRGYSEPFEEDERGLRLAATAGPIVERHAPRWLGRLHVEGFHASVESAAVGERLSTLIRHRDSAESVSTAIEAIASWLLQLARSTAGPPGSLHDERRRLAETVLPEWVERGAPRDLVDRLPQLAPVLQHNDVGSWNIVVGSPTEFVVVDWESAREHGLPLWDLLYFLVDVLSKVDGARTRKERAERSLRLLRGDSPSSPLLFAWVRRAVAEAGIPPDAVGVIATLCWLDHGLSHVARSEASERVQPGSAIVPPVERIAPVWLRDPALGPSWSCWRA
jgi:hypothetical protein